MHISTSSLKAHLLVLAPCCLLFEGGDVPERQATREVDDSQQGTVRAQTHSKNAILDVTKTIIQCF